MQVSSVNFWFIHNVPIALALSLYPWKQVHYSFLFKLRDLQLEIRFQGLQPDPRLHPHSHCPPAIWLVSSLSFICDKDTCGFPVFRAQKCFFFFFSNSWARSWAALVFRALEISLDGDAFWRCMLESYTQLPISQLIATEHTWCWNQKHFDCRFLSNLYTWLTFWKS